MERGWDPEVKKYFKKVLNSISLGLLWLMSMVTAGLYFGLAYAKGIYTVIFYVMMVASLAALLWKYYKMWSK
jgi:FtsH-binding integral membrane protein